jgi:hypothetical protein
MRTHPSLQAPGTFDRSLGTFGEPLSSGTQLNDSVAVINDLLPLELLWGTLEQHLSTRHTHLERHCYPV